MADCTRGADAGQGDRQGLTQGRSLSRNGSRSVPDDAQFSEKTRDVIGLYPAPPEVAAVPSGDRVSL